MLELHRATIHKIETTSDKCFKIVLFTPELPAGEMLSLLLAYKSGTEGIKIEEPETDDLKSPSQRLRNTLYRTWETTKREKDFETYYREQMEKLINHYKEKLP